MPFTETKTCNLDQSLLEYENQVNPTTEWWPINTNLIVAFRKTIVENYRKDARLPVQLQRAMAAEAEAAREARAKVWFHIMNSNKYSVYLWYII